MKVAPLRNKSKKSSAVSLFLPANELMFIVGTSGSGKSTVLEDEWVRENVMGIGQAVSGAGCVILEGASIFENVAVAAAAELRGRTSAVAREQVEEACRAAEESACFCAWYVSFIRVGNKTK